MSPKEDDEGKDWSCWLWTLFAAKGALCAYGFIGVHEAQSAVILPQLTKADSFIQITDDEAAWIASLGVLLAPVSAILIGPFIDAFGRKKGLQLFYLIMGLGFGVTACAREVYHIYIGRTVCAFAAGFETCVVVYIAEVSTEKQRTAFFSILSLVFNGGVPLSYIFSGYLPWNLASAILSFSCFIFFIAECFIPESPAWLFKMGRVNASVTSLQRLGRTKQQITRETELLGLSNHKSAEKVDLSTFLEPTVWKPFLILFVFHWLLAATGVYQILYYTVDFVERLGTTYDPLATSVFMATSRFISSAVLGAILKTSLGRKAATAVSSSGMAVALVGLGVYEYIYRGAEAAVRPYQWLPLAFMLVYMIACTLGIMAFPWFMSGELFPLKVRGTMAGAVSFVGYATTFVSVQLYYVSLNALQIHGLVFAFAGTALATVFFAIFVLPETADKSLLEIERGFLPKKKRPSTNAKIDTPL